MLTDFSVLPLGFAKPLRIRAGSNLKQMRFLAVWLTLLSSALAADPKALELLAKARVAYNANQERERYWNWTTVTNRSILNHTGSVVEAFPSVTVESPIRSDGQRCNAVLAWGDGVEPYLAKASADSRCTVEQEIHELLQEARLLESRQVRIESRSAAEIKLRIHRDPQAELSRDRFERCTGSVQGTLHLDPATLFPRIFDLEIAGKGCEQVVETVNHYDNHPVPSAMSTLRKGTTLHFEFALQKDKAENREKDYWICVRRRSVRPLPEHVNAILVWGRRMQVTSSGAGRQIVLDAATVASELAANTTVKFFTRDP